MKAVLFDLDMTLVDSSALAELRRQQDWASVMSSLSLVKVFPSSDVGAHELPGKLRSAGLKVGVITSSRRQYALAVLAAFKIPYDSLVAYEDTVANKPDAEPLNKALADLAVAASDAVYVGDAVDDAIASYRAGVFSIGAGWGVLNMEEFSGAATDVLFMKPSLILRLDELERRRYFAEAHANGLIPLAHRGSYLSYGSSPHRYALGRYHPRADKRHATSALSQRILDFKNHDTYADEFSRSLGAFITKLQRKWLPAYIVAVPPKPSQPRNRFKEVFRALPKYLPAGPMLLLEGLEAVIEVEDYKAKKAAERRVAVRDAFKSKYSSWNGCDVLLIDDVLTTGSTADECARTLLAKSAASVRVVALGKDQRPFEEKFCTCGRPMRVRPNGSTGVLFWGCSGFASRACTRTEDIDTE